MACRTVCYLCGTKKFRKRKGKVRDDSRLEVLECVACGLVFLSSFDHIHKDFYKEAQMHSEPTHIEIWLKDTAWDDDRRFIFLKNLIKNKSILDFGCGAGGFLMRAKKIASSIQGVEPERRLKNYFKKERIPVEEKFENIKKTFDVITLFHVLEHLPDPVLVLNRLSEKLKSKGCIIVEVPSADDALLKLYKNQPFSQFTYWSCHLFLFTHLTIARIAKKAGLKANYIKQVQRYPLSNHLYWLANGKPGGHKIWDFLDSKKLNQSFRTLL
jgi:SAM-dependent methyltransferase